MDKPKTEFILYSGLHTIGGVNASITYGKDRVVFEYGSAYDPKTDVYDGTVEKRSKNWLRDKLRLGILPRVDGVYSRADLGDDPLISAEESEYNTAVFITHLHLDHMAGIDAIAPEVPVYMHKNAQRIEEALEVVGLGLDRAGRKYNDLIPDVPVRVGEIEVYPIQTKVESYCDFAFYITTPDGTFHWTGDLALHGQEVDLTLRQLEMVKRRGVDVLLCDCTSFMDNVMEMMYSSFDAKCITPSPDVPEGMLSEQQYYDGLYDILKNQTGLCVFNFYQREMAEAERFIGWAKEFNRECVFEPDAAYVIYRFFGIKPNVYLPDSRRYPSDRAQMEPWLRDLLDNCRVVTLDEIHQNPGGYFLQNSFRHILELFDLPTKDSAYIHSDGIPIGAFDPAYARLRMIVDMAGFDYKTFFCQNYFGHGYPCQVKYFVDEINPKVLIPCHSFNPERLLPKDGVQLLPELYKKYYLANGTLKPCD